MDSKVFAARYERNLPADHYMPSNMQALLKPADEWAQAFGHYLHDALNGESLDAHELTDTVEEYLLWSVTDLPTIEQELNNGPWDNNSILRGHSSLHFHELNQPMITSWGLLLENPNQYIRRQTITFTQDLLALSALSTYGFRETESSAKHRQRYFHDENKMRNNHIEGKLNEKDSAIVLLEASKQHDNQVIFPAPPQFERTKNRAVNVDFLALRGLSQVVGIQVKGRVNFHTNATYERDIMLIDARTDLENELAKHTAPNTSTPNTVSWAGMISAHHILRIPFQPKKGQRLVHESLHTKDILKSKFYAKQLAGKITSRIPEATVRISSRLNKKFEDLATAV